MSILVASWIAMSLFNLLFVFMFNASSEDVKQSWEDIPFLIRLLIIFTPVGSVVIVGLILIVIYFMLSRVLSNE